jgi:NAD(P)-dependent dehydrogenase (short-subunit alcohol dehydrogenase family)
MINYELDEKVAVITGGASGIGLACAHAMARSGAAVSVWDLNSEQLESAAASWSNTAAPGVRQWLMSPTRSRSMLRWRPSLTIAVGSTSW